MLRNLYQSIASVSAQFGRLSDVRNTRAVARTALIACALGCAVHSPAAAASTEKVLHFFAGSPDGAHPYTAHLIKVNGTLYGTTTQGGAYNKGTVFSFNAKTHAETVLYSFGSSGTDGNDPWAPLINIKGTLYGTTWLGGANGQGTLFSFDPNTGAETVLYSFGNSATDGVAPISEVIHLKGKLYGTTNGGGAQYGGTVYSFDLKTGAEKVLHSFSGITDGYAPDAALINVDGKLYGTTQEGGVGNCSSGCGTVFSLDPNTGLETVLYSFGGGADGATPYADLINVDGTLYSTTLYGGTNNTGTVFSFNPATDAETVLYSFGGGTDGQYPVAGLINVNGTLYGNTVKGGTHGYGTAFSVNPNTGAETVLHSFSGGTDGQNPYAGLVQNRTGSKLYGTTYFGGTDGLGTVYSIKP